MADLGDGFELRRVRPGEPPERLATASSLEEARRQLIAYLVADGYFQIVRHGPGGRTVIYPELRVELPAPD